MLRLVISPKDMKFLNADKIFRSQGEIDRDTRKSPKKKKLVSSHLERRPDLLQ